MRMLVFTAVMSVSAFMRAATVTTTSTTVAVR
jgi:hypothetical protein